MFSLRPNARIRVHDILYLPVETNDIKEGDLVLDLGDFTVGYVDMKIENTIAIKYGYVTEVGVSITRVRKLIPCLETNTLN